MATGTLNGLTTQGLWMHHPRLAAARISSRALRNQHGGFQSLKEDRKSPSNAEEQRQKQANNIQSASPNPNR
jgi:hypothetical protein